MCLRKKQGPKSGLSSFLELTKEPDPDDDNINIVKMLNTVYFARAEEVTDDFWTIKCFSRTHGLITQAEPIFIYWDDNIDNADKWETIAMHTTIDIRTRRTKGLGKKRESQFTNIVTTISM